MRRLAVAFVVQGEGRGHMTQALALARFLGDAGHEVSRVLVGVSPFRTVPEYFAAEIGAPVETFDAPTQVPDRASRGCRPHVPRRTRSAGFPVSSGAVDGFTRSPSAPTSW